jgi:MOSC domain-containing protein YiiM
MKIISISVSRPRLSMWKGEPVSTGIFKEPVEGSVMLRTLNLDGDRQADLTVHGGPTKAVYAYPSEHYEFWKQELPEMQLPFGMFGENFTTEGMLEAEINIGDRFRIGHAELMVTEPRMPCYKLGIKFGRTDILRRFLVSGRSGFYFSVLQEGEVAAGDRIVPLSQDKHNVKVADIVRLYARDRDDLEMMRRAIEVKALPDSWRDYFLQRLESDS